MRSPIFAAALLTACGGVTESGDNSPVVETIEPSSGPLTGGTEVTMTGRNFDFRSGDTPVRVIVGNAVVEAVVVDESTLSLVTPPGDQGLAQVTVFHSGGAVPVSEGFIYAPLPEVRSISPAIASPGATVTVRGSGFEANNPGPLSVELGSAVLENLAVQSDTLLTGTVGPAQDPPFAAVDVTVTTDNGSATLGAAFKYTGPGLLAIRGLFNPRLLPFPGRDETKRGQWFYIDPSTAEARFIQTSTAPANKTAVRLDGSILALADRINPRQIGTISVEEGFTFNGPTTLSTGSNATDIVVDGTDYFEYQSTTVLRRFDVATGAQTNLATLAPALTRPACIFRRDATTLFAISTLDGQLMSVNKTTGAVADLGALGGPATNCHSATRIGNQVFAVSWTRALGEAALYRIENVDGTPQLVEVGVILENGEPIPIRSVVPTPPSF
jgi:hypothetical protein